MGEIIKKVSTYGLTIIVMVGAIIIIYGGYRIYNKNPDISMALIGIGILVACIELYMKQNIKNIRISDNDQKIMNYFWVKFT